MRKILKNLLCRVFRNAATETIDQKLLYVGQEEGKLIAIRQLIQQGLRPPVLIFVQSIERAKELFHELVYDGINVDVIHSERTKAQVKRHCFPRSVFSILLTRHVLNTARRHHPILPPRSHLGSHRHRTHGARYRLQRRQPRHQLRFPAICPILHSSNRKNRTSGKEGRGDYVFYKGGWSLFEECCECYEGEWV